MDYKEQQFRDLLILTLSESVEKFNTWREENPHKVINLSFANLQWFNLPGVNLSNVKLERTRCLWAKFQGADFRFANLSGANLQSCDLRGSNFTNANLSHVNLIDCITDQSTVWTGANFEGAYGIKDLNGEGL